MHRPGPYAVVGDDLIRLELVDGRAVLMRAVESPSVPAGWTRRAAGFLDERIVEDGDLDHVVRIAHSVGYRGLLVTAERWSDTHVRLCTTDEARSIAAGMRRLRGGGATAIVAIDDPDLLVRELRLPIPAAHALSTTDVAPGIHGRGTLLPSGGHAARIDGSLRTVEWRKGDIVVAARAADGATPPLGWTRNARGLSDERVIVEGEFDVVLVSYEGTYRGVAVTAWPSSSGRISLYTGEVLAGISVGMTTTDREEVGIEVEVDDPELVLRMHLLPTRFPGTHPYEPAPRWPIAAARLASALAELPNAGVEALVPRDESLEAVDWIAQLDHKAQVQTLLRARAADESRPWPAPRFRAEAAGSVTTGTWEQLSIAYSAGAPVEVIRDLLDALIADRVVAEDLARRHFDADARRGYEARERRYPYWYHTRMTTMALAVALEVDDMAFDALVDAEREHVPDRLIDRLIATRRPGRPVAADLLFAPRYRDLDAVFDAAPEDRERAVQVALRRWASGKRSMHFFRGDGRHRYGQWAFDVAGVVAALGIDDRGFASSPYYPSALTARLGVRGSPE